MNDHFERVAAAFSLKSGVYDAFGEGHENLTRLRQKVYHHLERVMPPGGHLLELNAGTGADAVEMLRRGFRVHAIDIAPGMVAEIERKIATQELQSALSVQACSFTELDQVYSGPFDGVYSNSGGLNCIADLRTVTRGLPRLLKPGAAVTFVVMPRFCPWELLTAIRNPRTGLRRLKGYTLARVEGVPFEVWYFSARETARAFGPGFRAERLEALLLTVPTADNDRFARRHPSLFRALTRLDDALSPLPPFNGWGDFFILTMRYVS